MYIDHATTLGPVCKTAMAGSFLDKMGFPRVIARAMLSCYYE